jgi:SAM-dependent methyltransferase
MATSKYVLKTGESGRTRLEILNAAMWPSSLRLLRSAGLKRGMRFLDVGCGPGALTARVAALGVEAVGADADEGFIRAARERHPHIRFECVPIQKLPSLGDRFDVVYARYLLSHLADPGEAVDAMMSVAKQGGRVVVEDIDFDLHIAEPRTAAFTRYIELYEAVVLARGGDPFLGRKLYRLLMDASLQGVTPSVQVTPAIGVARHLCSLTLEGIRDSVVSEGIASGEEVDGVLQELRALEDDPKALIGIAGTHQVWGRVPS